MEATELALFERGIEAAVAGCSGTELDAALHELGWIDALAADPRTAVSTLFTALGAAASTSSALEWAVAAALGLDGSTGLVLPALGTDHAPATSYADHITVHGIGTGKLADAETVVVVTARGGAHIAASVPAAALTRRSIRGLDPWLGWVQIDGDIAALDGKDVDWPAGVGMARRALAHELIGASRRMLDLAREHALERVQFGQPIARFQAIRHRLADVLVAIEAAEAMADAAWIDGSTTTAAMAKAVAGRSARTAARHCQQVLAGIGFTTEHPLHRAVRRALVLDQFFGASRLLTRALGDELLATRQLPPVLPL
jgi:alkylation response protein AidB-like acyl-CoA dehydrogenase